MPLAVCATPIGNLADVTLRVLDELSAADTVLCEDTRHTRVLLDRHGIEARLLSYHQHNEAARIADLIPRLQAGERIALVSDAGLPGVNDPGARLVAAALAAGIPVTVLPGASAVETALVASGLAGEQYRFVGYFPRSERDRAALWRELVDWEHPTVGFESPKRLAATLASLAGVEPERRVAVCRELTKIYEEVVADTAATLAGALSDAAEGRGDARDRPDDADGRCGGSRRGRRRARRRGVAAQRRRGRRCATHRALPQRALQALSVGIFDNVRGR